MPNPSWRRSAAWQTVYNPRAHLEERKAVLDVENLVHRGPENVVQLAVRSGLGGRRWLTSAGDRKIWLTMSSNIPLGAEPLVYPLGDVAAECRAPSSLRIQQRNEPPAAAIVDCGRRGFTRDGACRADRATNGAAAASAGQSPY